MKLFYREFGTEGRTLLILHGLYGASDNWISICKELGNDFKVYALDLRNHGQSPHNDDCSYKAMTEDVIEFMNDREIPNVVVLGHSMGANVAMYLASFYPTRILGLIVEDMSVRPDGFDIRNNPNYLFHSTVVNSMCKLDFTNIRSRSDVDKLLQTDIPDAVVRQFLLKNLEHKDNGRLGWKLNICKLRDNLIDIMQGLSVSKSKQESVKYPVLFIKGGLSKYIDDEGLKACKQVFPALKLVTIEGAGHWVHSEKMADFIALVRDFLNN